MKNSMINYYMLAWKKVFNIESRRNREKTYLKLFKKFAEIRNINVTGIPVSIRGK